MPTLKALLFAFVACASVWVSNAEARGEHVKDGFVIAPTTEMYVAPGAARISSLKAGDRLIIATNETMTHGGYRYVKVRASRHRVGWVLKSHLRELD